MQSDARIAAERGERTVVMTQLLNAPRRIVFDAWTKPDHVARWWGRNGSSLVVCEIDLRIGGEYRFVELGPDGIEYPFRGEYLEISPPERLVYTWIFDEEPFSNSVAVVTLTLVERGERTWMTSTTLFPSVEERDVHLRRGMERGSLEMLVCLEEHVGRLR